MHQAQYASPGLVPAQPISVLNKAIKQFDVCTHNPVILFDDCLSLGFLQHETGHLLIELRLTNAVIGFKSADRIGKCGIAAHHPADAHTRQAKCFGEHIGQNRLVVLQHFPLALDACKIGKGKYVIGDQLHAVLGPQVAQLSQPGLTQLHAGWVLVLM